ncbi:MAG: HAD-IIB family hydrolase [Deltaproteobacteria bacterium]|nr:HAD-IIB family hydrolase [Deltaproteobacteria bacterium]
MPSEFVIFTDLDGTLLDYESYSFEAASSGLEFISSKNIPIVICTSKTRAEIELYRKLLNNNEPFISENGGGIFIPSAYFSHNFNYDRQVDSYKVIELGTPHKRLIEVLNSIKKDASLKVKGFSEMTIEELSEVSGLSREIAELAIMREYDEPFIIYGDENDKERKKNEITRRGFKHTEGGIFHHIMGDNDKGKAVKILTNLFKQKFSNLKTIAIGDSLNDLPMLEAVDIPILVQKPDGQYDSRIKLDNLVFAEGIGPEGWNNAILNLFEKIL